MYVSCSKSPLEILILTQSKVEKVKVSTSEISIPLRQMMANHLYIFL